MRIISIQQLIQSAASRFSETDRWSLSTAVTVPSSPFDSIGTEEIAEARENLAAKNQDMGKTAVTDVAAYPIEVLGRLMNESHLRSGSKTRNAWRKVKQVVVRCTST